MWRGDSQFEILSSEGFPNNEITDINLGRDRNILECSRVKNMKREEKIVFDHLRKAYGGDIVFEPYKNSTPDFSINSSIGVEVTRLNQHYFEGTKPEGLENLSYDLSNALDDVLESINSSYTGKNSYWIYVSYKRLLSSNIRKTKKEIMQAMKNFLDLDITIFPFEIIVNPEITISLDKKQINDGILIELDVIDDSDEGGWVISTYVENICHCITKKSDKVSKHLQEYKEWWLYLVDYMRLGLDKDVITEVVNLVKNIGNFDKVFLLSYEGADLIASINKE